MAIINGDQQRLIGEWAPKYEVNGAALERVFPVSGIGGGKYKALTAALRSRDPLRIDAAIAEADDGVNVVIRAGIWAARLDGMGENGLKAVGELLRHVDGGDSKVGAILMGVTLVARTVIGSGLIPTGLVHDEDLTQQLKPVARAAAEPVKEQ